MFGEFNKWFLLVMSCVLITMTAVSARRIKGNHTSVIKLDEQSAHNLSLNIAQELHLEKLLAPYSSIFFISPASEIFHCKRGSYGYENWVDENGNIKLIRLGCLFFVDAEGYAGLNPELRNRVGGNIVVVNDLSESVLVDFSGQGCYTLATIAVMLNSDLNNMRVVDCGAGEGILSIVASRLGAKFLELVEIDERKLKMAEVNLELNGLQEGRDFKLICEDLNNVAAVVSQLAPDFMETAIISNIGAWPKFYTADNQVSMQCIEGLSNVRLFIAGGYNTLLNNRALRRDKREIRKRGFEIIDEADFGIFGKFIAWVAERKY